MLTTGNQLKAARALVGMEQLTLAEKANVNVGTIRKMEAKGMAVLTSGLDTVRAVQGALEAVGIAFIPENGGGVGVRLREPGVVPE